MSEIVDALRAQGADAVADGILSKSPTALAVTLESLRRASPLPSLEEEFVVSMNALQHPEFARDLSRICGGRGRRARLLGDHQHHPRPEPRGGLQRVSLRVPGGSPGCSPVAICRWLRRP